MSGEEVNGKFIFNNLEDWRLRNEDAIRHYSGMVTYRKVFNITNSSIINKKEIFLNLGVVKETAQVRLNGKDLGVAWCYPWRVDISGVLKEGENQLEIDVVNLWPNRLIGDASIPIEKRKTHTNVITYNPNSPLLSSGLLGPVTIQVAKNF